MRHLNGGIACLLSCTNLLGVVAPPAYFDSQSVIANGALDMDPNIEFNQVALFKNHLTFEPLGWIQQAVSRVVRSHVVD